jgi:Protein of unknown function (DUF4013)
MEPVSYFAGQDRHVRYWAAYKFVFSSPNGWKNLLILSGAMLVPIVGPVVAIGYLCDVLEPRPIDDGTGRAVEPPRPIGSGYPDFNFSLFVQYLERGIWPFVASLVASLIMLPLMVVVIIPAIVAVIAGGGDAMLAVGIIASAVLCIAATLAGIIVMVPLTLRAAMVMEFGPTFSLDWAKDFVARTWRDVLIAWLFLMATSIPLVIVGYLMCFIGMYPAMALITVAQWHLDFQLYHLYVSRGGAPVPIKPLHLQPPPQPPPIPPPTVASPEAAP